MSTAFSRKINFASSTLSVALGDGVGDLTATVQTGDGALFACADDVYIAVWTLNPTTKTIESFEMLKQSDQTGDVLTAARGQCGTDRVYHPVGSIVRCVDVAEYLDEVQDAVNAIENGTTLGPTTFTGDIIAGSATNANRYIRIISNAGFTRGLRFQTGEYLRWQMYAYNAAETGGDAGSNFYINANTDAGVYIDNVLSCIRAAGGTMTFGRPSYFVDNVSALSFTDRTPAFEGDALGDIAKITSTAGKIDHATLPESARRQVSKVIHIPEKDTDGKPTHKMTPVIEIEEGRDLGNMISILTRALQQQIELNATMAARLDKLEKGKP